MSKICPTCGKNYTNEARFCGVDGSLLESSLEASVEARGPEMLCPQCKRDYPAYARYCPVDRAMLTPSKANNMQGSQAVSGSYDSLSQERTGTTILDQTNLDQTNLGAGGDSLSNAGTPYIQNTAVTASMAPTGSLGTPAADFLRAKREEEEEALAYTGGYTGNLVGKTIDGKYLIQSMLGEGGMAIVYKAHHTIMERQVVIKVMQGWLLSNDKSKERFQRECQLTAKLNHPNIVIVHDVGTISGKAPYLVMEYIKGESLAEKIRRQGALPMATCANIIIQICRGLQEAHNFGIIHRDLKPDNVLLQDRSDRPDWVKIVDFGISHFVHGEAKRLTKTGRMVGTPEYVAPEQLRDVPMDIRTDLYQLGIMLYEMLTGAVPFEGESAESVLMKHLIEEVPPMSKYKPEFKDGTPFDPIVAKLLRKDPDERYQTATELRLEIEQIQSDLRSKRP